MKCDMTTLLTYLSRPIANLGSYNERTMYNEGMEVLRFDMENSLDYHVSIHGVNEIVLDEPQVICGTKSQRVKIKQGDNTIDLILFFTE